MQILRTPDDRFEGLVDWPYAPKYFDITDADGTVNLLEFALGLDPLVSGPQPVRSRVTDGGLVIEFDRPAAMAEVVNWVLEEATDPQAMVGWTPSDSALEVVGEADGRQTVRAVVPVVGQRKFVRLRVRMR